MDPTNLTALVAFFAAALAFPPYIRWLKSQQIEQHIREEGPQSHAAKAKTPTMGGLCFIVISAAVAAGYIVLLPDSTQGGWSSARVDALMALVTGIACGAVGFADDFGKVRSKSNKGLSASGRLKIEFGLGLALALALYLIHSVPDSFVGFGGAVILSEPVKLAYLFIVIPFLVAATTNALNLHDGMDGLAGGTSVLVFSVLFFMLLILGKLYLAAICAALVGSVTAFLMFNRNPASVFMGDTGSLYLGGIMAAVVAVSGLLLWFVPLALIYIVETLSVIAQVVYFKLTKEYAAPAGMSPPAIVFTKLTKRLPGEGKRLFRMAPLHHHFEAIGADRGEPEWKVVAYFWMVQFLLCAFVWMLFSVAFNA